MPLEIEDLVSRETLRDLEDFSTELRRWSRRINLVSNSTHDGTWRRHVVDSAQLAFLLSHPLRTWCDLGSGGGLPAIPVALINRERHPRAGMTCIESDRRKATFLRMMAQRYGLALTVVAERIEQCREQRADVVSARALAPLPSLLRLVRRHLAPTGVAVLPKGRAVSEELNKAREEWTFDLVRHQSVTEPESEILEIRNINPREMSE